MLTVTPANIEGETKFYIYQNDTDSEALHHFLSTNDPGEEYTVTFENYFGDEPFDDRDYQTISFFS